MRPITPAVRETDQGASGREEGEGPAPQPGSGAPEPGVGSGASAASGAGRGGAAAAPPGGRSSPGKKRGRPRGGRRSNPDYVQFSARVHRDVKLSFDRVLAEQSEREGRYVEREKVVEDLIRFYVRGGDPYA